MIHRLLRPRLHDTRSDSIWFTVYADLITTLALVFLALYGLELMGEDAISKALKSMSLDEMEDWERNSEASQFEEVKPILKEKFKNRPDVLVSSEADLVRLEFGEEVLFDSGRAKLKHSATPVLMEVAGILSSLPYTIVVEGHTDDRPLKQGGAYRDNWELSLARAMSIVRMMSDSGKITDDQMAAAAYGYHRPRASNLTSAGRRMNRRVEIVLLKEFPYSPNIKEEQVGTGP